MSPINLDRIQSWIDQGRLDPSQPITMKELNRSRCLHGVKRHGVKLLGRVRLPSFFLLHHHPIAHVSYERSGSGSATYDGLRTPCSLQLGTCSPALRCMPKAIDARVARRNPSPSSSHAVPKPNPETPMQTHMGPCTLMLLLSSSPDTPNSTCLIQHHTCAAISPHPPQSSTLLTLASSPER